MLRIHPFPALVPIPNKAAQVAAPPYDTVDDAEARALAAGRPDSFIRVTRAEVDFPPGTSSDDEAVHAAARERLRALVSEGLLRRQEDAIFLYRIVGRGHRQTGVVACCDVAAYEQGQIVRHERTRPDKETERTRHIAACAAHTEPVLLAHRDHPEIEDLVRRDTCERPRCHFVGPDGATHTIWSVPSPQCYVARFAHLDKAYVCDGHHRAAAAARVAREMPDSPEAGRFPAVLFPFSTLRILPYHRVVRDLNGLDGDRFRRRLEGVGHLEPSRTHEPGRRGDVGVYVEGKWWNLTLDPLLAMGPAAADSLDVSALQRLVLEPILGIADPRTDRRIDFVGGARGTEFLAREVDEGRAAVAFAMHATSLHELLAVAERGEIMPPKSTWFDPKPASGLVVHPFDV